MLEKKRSQSFNQANYSWKRGINYRDHPHLYQVGKGEQGVLICEPYKSEILPHWKFKTPEIAQKGAESIYSLFLDYLKKDDFVGADMARKFLQMGFTRARRYANYKGGHKYRPDGQGLFIKGSGDPIKAESASIYYQFWKKAEKNSDYQDRKSAWKKKYG